MASIIRRRHKPASLTVQVMHAERQVLARRRLVGIRATLLGRNIRRQWTSPAMLLLAGGLGFVAGHFIKRRASTPGNTTRARTSLYKLFGKGLKLIAFARTLSGVFSSVVMNPPVQTELPDQSPAPPYQSAIAS